MLQRSDTVHHKPGHCQSPARPGASAPEGPRARTLVGNLHIGPGILRINFVFACNTPDIVCCPLQIFRALAFIWQFLYLLGICCLCIFCIPNSFLFFLWQDSNLIVQGLVYFCLGLLAYASSRGTLLQSGARLGPPLGSIAGFVGRHMSPRYGAHHPITVLQWQARPKHSRPALYKSNPNTAKQQSPLLLWSGAGCSAAQRAERTAA